MCWSCGGFRVRSKIADALEAGVDQFFIYSHHYENLPANEQHIQEIVAALVKHDEKPWKWQRTFSWKC
jgi:hypothetical protein